LSQKLFRTRLYFQFFLTLHLVEMTKSKGHTINKIVTERTGVADNFGVGPDASPFHHVRFEADGVDARVVGTQ